MKRIKNLTVFSRYIDGEYGKKILVFIDGNKNRVELECDDGVFYNAVLFSRIDVEVENSKIVAVV